MTQVGDVLSAPGLPPLKVCGVMNGRFVVTPADQFGASELLDPDRQAAYGIEGPRSDTRPSVTDPREDPKVREYFENHPETERARRLEARYGRGWREGSPEWVFARDAQEAARADES